MPQAVVDPEELRQFAQSLKSFNHQLRDRAAALANQLAALSSTWRDQEHKKFAEQFDANMKVLLRFADTADDYVPYLLRKAREAVLTSWMEFCLPKRRILELYLNVVELGPGVFGAEAASQLYFDRPAVDLTASQAALLAATLTAPLERNPGAPTPGLRRRQRLVLARMDRWYGRGGEAEEPAEGPARRPEVRPSEPLEIPALGRESIPAREASAAESLPAPETPAAPPDTEPPPGGP